MWFRFRKKNVINWIHVLCSHTDASFRERERYMGLGGDVQILHAGLYNMVEGVGSGTLESKACWLSRRQHRSRVLLCSNQLFRERFTSWKDVQSQL